MRFGTFVLSSMLAVLLRPAAAHADDHQLPWLLPSPSVPLSLLYCPNYALAGRCGNGICEFGEDSKNCPYDCDVAPIKNWNGDLSCSAGARVLAMTDVVGVAPALLAAAGAGLHVRATGARHSDNSLVCSDEVLIDVSPYSGVIGLATGSDGGAVVRVKGGTTGIALLQWLFDRGLMLEGYAMPAFREGTVAGMLATGSHGGSRRHAAMLADIVDQVRILAADGTLKTYDRRSSPAAWRAATVSLGLLGIIVDLSFKVRPYRNLEVNVEPYPEEQWLAGALLHDPADCDWDIFYWAPRTHQVSRICARETSRTADPLIENTSLRHGVLGDSPVVNALELGALSSAVCDGLARCVVHGLASSDDLFKGYFSRLRPDGTDTDLQAFVGRNHLVTTSQSGDLRRVGFRTYELAIAGPKVSAALAAIQAMVEREPCGLLGDFSVRFAPTSASSWLGQNPLGEATETGALARQLVMFIEVNGYLPPGLNAEQRAVYDAFNNNLVRLLIDRFQARPHWGKGQSWVLRYAAAKQVFGPDWESFRRVVNQADPAHLFRNDLVRELGL